MKRIILTMIIVLGLSGLSMAQNLKDTENKTISKNLNMDFHVSEYQEDFGLGISAASPYFVYDRIAIRMRGNLMYNQIVSENESTWEPYLNISLGLIGVAREIEGFMRLYGEGGPIMLFPSGAFSSKGYLFGGYGLFGFESYISENFNYQIEIGSVGMGATEDKIQNKPIYSNGMLINTGFRMHF